MGFEGSATVGRQYWDAALRYGADWGNMFRVIAGVGYFKNTETLPGDVEQTDDTGWGGSIAIRHIPTGLNIAFNHAVISHTENCAVRGVVSGLCRGDDEVSYVKGGIVSNLTEWGLTVFYGSERRSHRRGWRCCRQAAQRFQCYFGRHSHSFLKSFDRPDS
jgi:hypothetical protein